MKSCWLSSGLGSGLLSVVLALESRTLASRNWMNFCISVLCKLGGFSDGGSRDWQEKTVLRGQGRTSGPLGLVLHFQEAINSLQ